MNLVEASSLRQHSIDSGRVLVVDDQPMLRRLLTRSLIRAGFAVVEADNGLAALELLKQERFDLVVSDVNMPLMDGIELLGALSTSQPDLPVVLISGSLDVQGQAEARRLGAFDLLKKPFAMTELQQTASRAMQHRHQDRRLDEATAARSHCG